MTKQTWTAAVAALLFVTLAAVIAMVPVPFVTWSPGSTYNLLGTVQAEGETAEVEAIRIDGVATYPADGEVRMATVSVTRPDSALTLPEALLSYWMPSREVLPRDAVYRPGANAGELQDDSIRLMDDSQTTAVVAALRVAGVTVEELPMVSWVSLAGPAHDQLLPGDLIVAVDNQPVEHITDVQAAIAAHSIGEAVKIDLIRDRRELSKTVTTRASSTSPPTPSIGVGLDTGFRFEPRVTFHLSPAIGGPSAGLPFAIAIYSMLTPDELLAGRIVAGTGTLDAKGRVGQIGAVQEKIAAAVRDGATVFLLPTANCGDAEVEHEGLQLVPVDNLGDALAALATLTDPALAGTVPRCP
ncbi:MAG: PDZ domain-containing protein [Propionibacteriaceae bacterium]|nr:PDZ domain-containing protein [Propionibacteriaceae bacterium]